jgi:CubicO group peptidase (beta-lactamase class C family)
MRRAHLLVLILAATLLAASSLAEPPKAEPQLHSPESVGFSSERLARLDPVIQGYVDRNEVPGAVALVARHGKVVYHKSFGQRDVAAGAAMGTDTIFRIASMTKPIASVALMMLWEEGAFQLRDPISEHLPEFANMRIAVAPEKTEYASGPTKLIEAERPITFQQILTHTAGLANPYRGFTKPMYDELRAKVKPGWTIGDYVTELAKLPLNFHPGDGWEYGPATDVAGRLVEVISGQKLDAFISERILGPLQMTDTHFYLPRSKLSRFVANYTPDENGKITLTEAADENSRFVREPHVYFSGAGGMVSTSSDYFRFQQMMLNGGELDGVRILGRKTVELMTTNHVGDHSVWLRGAGYGFGLGYSVVTDQGQTALPASLGSFAWGGAYCTVFWVDPVEEVIGILMSQVRPYTHLNIREDIQSLAYQALVD